MAEEHDNSPRVVFYQVTVSCELPPRHNKKLETEENMAEVHSTRQRSIHRMAFRTNDLVLSDEIKQHGKDTPSVASLNTDG
jgi:hypothetical protein